MLKPNIVRIETTNMCNKKCLFCPHKDMTRTKGTMSKALYDKIIDDCIEIGVKEVHLQNFGEPLLDNDIFDRIKAINGKMKTVMFTNGMLLNDMKVEKLIFSGLDVLFISYNENDQIVKENIKRLYNFKLRLKVNKPKIIINTISGNNDIARFAENINTQRVHNWATGISNNKLWCNTFWDSMTVTWNGKVLFCCLDYDAKYSVGDVNKSTISDVWNNNAYKMLRNKVKIGKINQIELCSKCNVKVSIKDMIKTMLKWVKEK